MGLEKKSSRKGVAAGNETRSLFTLPGIQGVRLSARKGRFLSIKMIKQRPTNLSEDELITASDDMV